MAEVSAGPIEALAEELVEEVDKTSFDPSGGDEASHLTRRWWGNHIAEFRWQAELARLLVDPV